MAWPPIRSTSGGTDQKKRSRHRFSFSVFVALSALMTGAMQCDPYSETTRVRVRIINHNVDVDIDRLDLALWQSEGISVRELSVSHPGSGSFGTEETVSLIIDDDFDVDGDALHIRVDGLTSETVVATGFQDTFRVTRGNLIDAAVVLGPPGVYGNGIVTADIELCDDGNQMNGDGCSDVGLIEAGWNCQRDEPSTCATICGDAILIGSEQCDDGNRESNDGCSAACLIEEGYACDAPGAPCESTCGDGVVDTFEECDTDEPGCSGMCTIFPGWSCSPSGTCTDDCGDGTVDDAAGEQCDDGNVESGDGCLPNCRIENGWSCMPNQLGTSVCLSCGNGILEGDELCDDGNSTDLDGCSAECLLEDGWSCDEYEGRTFCSASCGDGLTVATEECDDGNALDGDGCLPTCHLETGWRCDDIPDGCVPVPHCGDGLTLYPYESCDLETAGCNSETCFALPGYVCTSTGCATVCGDSIIAGDETCDDGNPFDFDGCSDECQNEDDAQCGDGRISPAEECDDGDLMSGDGCDENCKVELADGYLCHGVPSQCAVCGDGSVGLGEECDLNAPDQSNNFGCTGCEITPGFSCVNTGSVPSTTLTCSEGCGDGILDESSGEECDDGNNINGDKCSDICKIEICPSGAVCNISTGWVCPTADTCTPVCGDGLIRGHESCDDGNGDGGDGCSQYCIIEPGWGCSSKPGTLSQCVALACGDEITAGLEQCDDGNINAGDGCIDCRLEAACGNGIIEDGEQCDDGNTMGALSETPDGCDQDCRVDVGFTCVMQPSECTAICGDGIIRGQEQCDDDVYIPGNGCDVTCMLEPVNMCGDGNVLSGVEECDDGNTTSGDGCSATCTIEGCGNGIVEPGEQCDDGGSQQAGVIDGCDDECSADDGWQCAGSPSACAEDSFFLNASTYKTFSGCALKTLEECIEDNDGILEVIYFPSEHGVYTIDSVDGRFVKDVTIVGDTNTKGRALSQIEFDVSPAAGGGDNVGNSYGFELRSSGPDSSATIQGLNIFQRRSNTTSSWTSGLVTGRLPVIIVDSSIGPSTSRGIYMRDGTSSLTMRRSIVHGNPRGGILLNNASGSLSPQSLTVENSLIAFNGKGDSSIGGIQTSIALQPNGKIVSTTIVGNLCNEPGGCGVDIEEAAPGFSIAGSILWQNRAAGPWLGNMPESQLLTGLVNSDLRISHSALEYDLVELIDENDVVVGQLSPDNITNPLSTWPFGGAINVPLKTIRDTRLRSDADCINHVALANVGAAGALPDLDHELDARQEAGDGLIDCGWDEWVYVNDGCQHDGIVEGDEECDVGDFGAADGCEDDCQITPGFRCAGQPSICAPEGRFFSATDSNTPSDEPCHGHSIRDCIDDHASGALDVVYFPSEGGAYRMVGDSFTVGSEFALVGDSDEDGRPLSHLEVEASGDQGLVFEAASSPDSIVTLQGLNISGADGSSIPTYFWGMVTSIDVHLNIVGTHIGPSETRAIATRQFDGSGLELRRSSLVGNKYGGIMFGRYGQGGTPAPMIIENTLIAYNGNLSDTASVGAIQVDRALDSSSRIVSSTIVGNRCEELNRCGVDIHAPAPNFYITGSIIWQNRRPNVWSLGEDQQVYTEDYGNMIPLQHNAIELLSGDGYLFDGSNASDWPVGPQGETPFELSKVHELSLEEDDFCDGFVDLGMIDPSVSLPIVDYELEDRHMSMMDCGWDEFTP